MSDAALVPRARGGDEVAFRRLLDRHGDVIRYQRSLVFPSHGLDDDDLEQEAQFGFFKAVRDYRAGAGSSFRSFASLCVERQIITALKTATRGKHRVLSDAYSMEHPAIGADDSEDLTLEQLLPAPESDQPAARAEQAETLATVTSVVTEALSPLEQAATIGRAEGRPYKEIAEWEGTNAKAIDNAIQRGERKIAEALGEAA